MKLLILLSILISSSQSFAASICSDLESVTCAKGERHDGTGSSKFGDVLSFVNAEISTIKPRLISDFKKLINDNADLRETAVQAFDLSQESVCKNKTQSPNCLEFIAERMIDSYKLKEFGPQILSVSYFFSGDALATSKLTSDERYTKIIRKIADEQKAVVSSQLLEKVKTTIFPQAKELLIERIRAMSLDKSVKNRILKTISSATYRGTNCQADNAEASGIAEAFVPNAFYDPEQNSLYFCLGYFRASDSEFNIVQTIVHELAHSIDPCHFSDGTIIAPLAQKKSIAEVDDTYLKKGFLACLRSKDSIAAKHLQDDTPMPMSYDEPLVYNDTQRLCGGDELGEAVPDWFAAEVLGLYSEKYFSHLTVSQKRNGFSNILRPTCGETRSETTVHPDSKKRLNGLLLVQPKVRAQMGCATQSPMRYCDIDRLDTVKGKPLESGPKKSKSKSVR